MPEINAQTHIVTSNENTQEDLSAAAKKLYDEGNYEQALKIYSDMLLYSSDSDLYVKMGTCFEKEGKEQTAIEYWEKAIEVDSMNSNAYINLGNCYYKKNKIEKAISYWIASLVAMPEEPTANLNLAVAYSVKNMPTQAFIYYERYLKFAQDKTSEKYLTIKTKMERNIKLGNDYLKLGVQYQTQGDNLSALKCYKRATAYCPILSKAYLNSGSLYYADKNYEEAVKYWIKALYIDPGYPKIINNLAITYDMLKKFDYAYCYYSRYSQYTANKPLETERIVVRCNKIKPFLNANPYLIENHKEAAEEAFAQCNYFKALNEFKNYLILDPSQQQTHLELLLKIDNFLNPDREIINGCMIKGAQLMNKGNFQEAKPYFARVLVLANSGTKEYSMAKRDLSLCIHQSL